MGWRRLQIKGTKRGMNKAMIEVIQSSHLQIGNHKQFPTLTMFTTEKKERMQGCIFLFFTSVNPFLSSKFTEFITRKLTDIFYHLNFYTHTQTYPVDKHTAGWMSRPCVIPSMLPCSPAGDSVSTAVTVKTHHQQPQQLIKICLSALWSAWMCGNIYKHIGVINYLS